MVARSSARSRGCWVSPQQYKCMCFSFFLFSFIIIFDRLVAKKINRKRITLLDAGGGSEHREGGGVPEHILEVSLFQSLPSFHL